MTDTSAPQLPLPARQVVLRLARVRLAEWDRARANLDDPADTEALHDFRVALRKLRSLLRAFRPVSDDLVPRRLQQRLRRLSDATCESRDLEVERAWLLGRLAQLTPKRRIEGKWLVARLGRREAAANERLRPRLEKKCGRVREKLLAILATASRDGIEDRDESPILASSFVAQGLAEWGADLDHRLRAIQAITDEAELHNARICVKRLRYLLEPFQAELAGASATIALLKQLQDLLGDLHDLTRIAADLRVAFRETAIHHAETRYHDLLPWGELESTSEPPIPATTGGLVALARIVRAEGEALLARLSTEWLDGDHGDRLGFQLRALGVIVAAPDVETPAPPSGADVRPEYKAGFHRV